MSKKIIIMKRFLKIQYENDDLIYSWELIFLSIYFDLKN